MGDMRLNADHLTKRQAIFAPDPVVSSVRATRRVQGLNMPGSVPTDIDPEGNLIDPVRVEWSSGGIFTTPPGWWHSHHNDTDEDAWVLPIQVCRVTLITDPSFEPKPIPFEPTVSGMQAAWGDLKGGHACREGTLVARDTFGAIAEAQVRVKQSVTSGCIRSRWG